MNLDPSSWNDLASRARQGEVAAAAELKEALAPQMGRLVRRALTGGAARSVVERQILAEAERTRLQHPDRAHDTEEMVRLVTQRVCARLLHKQTTPFLPTIHRPDTAVA